MKITFNVEPEDPPHPFMHGSTPTAKEFNKRQAELWKNGKLKRFDFEQVTTVLLEIFAADYDSRHAPKKVKK